MGSKRIKIIVLLLAVAAIAAAAFFIHPKRFHVDQTQYSMVRLTDPNGSPLQVIAINSSGQMVGYLPIQPGGVTSIYLIHPDGRAQALPIPKEYRPTPISINNRGAIVGSVFDQNHAMDAFVCDPQWGFQLVPVRDAFPNANSQAEKINSKGIIVGLWERKQTYSKGVFFYDPNEGVFDIEPLSQIAVSIDGLDEDGMIVGEYHAPLGRHAFLWTQQKGLVDLHPGETRYTNSSAMAVNDNGWMLVRMYNKNADGEFVWIHRELGKSRSFTWNYQVFEANPIPFTDRFTVMGYRPSLGIGLFHIRPAECNNWIFQRDHKPVLLNPKELSNKRWSIIGMDDKGAIVGNTFGFRDAPTNVIYPSEGFILRPIRPSDPAGK